MTKSALFQLYCKWIENKKNNSWKLSSVEECLELKLNLAEKKIKVNKWQRTRQRTAEISISFSLFCGYATQILPKHIYRRQRLFIFWLSLLYFFECMIPMTFLFFKLSSVSFAVFLMYNYITNFIESSLISFFHFNFASFFSKKALCSPHTRISIFCISLFNYMFKNALKIFSTLSCRMQDSWKNVR